MTPWIWLGAAVAGEIFGVVAGPGGEPVEGTLVLAYDHRLQYELAYAEADGSFLIDGLKDSQRRVRFVTPDAFNAVEMYLPAGTSLCEAELVEVVKGERTEIGVVALSAGGTVRGRVLGPTGLPVGGADVISRPAGVTPTSLPRSAETDADGYFVLTGVPVAADGPLWSFEVESSGLPDQYLGEAFDVVEAEAFGVGIGGETDLGEWTLRPGGTVSGLVVGPSGPVTEGTVFASTTGRSVSAGLVDGSFSLGGLAPGEAHIWVESAGLGITWYPGTPEPGVTVTVSDDQEVAGLQIEMPPEAVVRGRLVGLVDEFSATKVVLVNEARTVSSSKVVSPDGSFQISSLPAGNWSFELAPEEGLDLVDGPMLDDEGNRWMLALEAGKTLDLGDVDVPRGAVVEGRVFDRETGEGVYGAWVYVVNATTGSSVLERTGRGGRYRAEGLAAGVYRIRAEYQPYCDPDPDWVTLYYPDQRNELLTGSIPLAPGQVTRWEPELPPDMDHDGMGDVWERRFGLDPQRDDGFEDLDGDGFTNLDEYLLGTDPSGGSGGGSICGGGGSAWLLFGLPLAAIRRRRVDRVAPPV